MEQETELRRQANEVPTLPIVCNCLLYQMQNRSLDLATGAYADRFSFGSRVVSVLDSGKGPGSNRSRDAVG